MIDIGDLDLAHLPVEQPAFAQDPFPYFAAARRQHPWLAKCAFAYVPTEYKAIRELMLNEEKMRIGHTGIVEIMGGTGTRWGTFIAESVQVQWGDTHKRLRTVLAPAFTPQAANVHRPLMRQVISDLLDEWAPKGAFDFEEFVAHFPISVMCQMLGASPGIVPRIRSSLEALGIAFGMEPGNLPILQQSVELLDGFVREFVAERRAGKRPGPDRDLLDLLLKAHDDGGMSPEELYNLLIFLFAAGYDTSKNMITMIMYALLYKPDVYARCGEDAAYSRRVVNEVLRYHSVSSGTRFVMEDIVMRDVRMPKGTFILIPWSVLGRDATAVASPDEFKPERAEGSPHVAFGLGPHICLGQFIARAQIEEGFHLIAKRLRKPILAGGMGWRPFPGVWGIHGLPITFEPG
jgi:cytochrome P450